MKLYWNRLVCAFLGHEYDTENYVRGSWELSCLRCDTVERM